MAVLGTLAMGGIAHAATVTISSATTTPLATSTVDGGSPGDIAIASGGSITLSSGTALTLDSDNTITNSGSVSIDDSDNSIGVSIAPNTTGEFANGGSITLGKADTSVTHPNYANNKRGLILTSGGSFTGNIAIASAGTMVVRGDSSVGIDLEGNLVGNLTNQGSISITGDNSTEVRVGSALTGKIGNSGLISAQGINSSALEIVAPVSGLVENDGTIQATGYDHLTVSTSTGPDNYNATQATQQSLAAVRIGASLQGGLYNSGSTSGNGATISSVGSADALLISPTVSGGAAGDIVISKIATSTAGYGIINAGTITGSGLYDGVSAEAVRIEGSATHTTTVEGGLQNAHTINGTASEASATGLAIGLNATVPKIENEGTISANATSSAASTATALSIETGASVPSLNNTGSITASFTGPTGSATAVRDLSGSLVDIHNTGIIATVVAPKTGETQASGSAVALDLSATSNDITITNDLPSGYDPASGVAAGEIIGDTKLGSGSDTFNMVDGSVRGAIDFGGGNDTLNLSGGSIIGDLAFGAGMDTVHMTGGTFQGGLSDSDGQLNLDLSGGTFIMSTPSTVNITSASVASGAKIGFAVDDTGANVSHLVASGAVTFDPGSVVTAHFTGGLPQQVDANIVTASTLNISGDPNSVLQLSLPFVYAGSLSTSTSGSSSSLTLHLVRKSAADLGIRSNLAPGLDPLLAVLKEDTPVANEVLNATTNADFDKAFIQFMPSYTDASLVAGKLATRSFTRSINSRIERLFVDQVGVGAWTDEHAFTTKRDNTATARGYRTQGFALSLGLDDYLTDNIVLGVIAGFDGASYHEASDNDSPVSTRHWTGGVYSGAHWGRLFVSGSAMLGYGNNSDTRKLILGSVVRTATGDWSGWRYSADADIGYAASFSGFYLRPNAGVTFLHVSDNAFTERGGANSTGGNAFALSYASRSADAAMAHADVTIGTNILQRFSEVGYGTVMQYTVSPELRFGWNYDLINTPIKTKARFVSSTDWFTVESDTRQRQTLNAGLGFHVNTNYGSFGAGLEAMVGSHRATYGAALHAAFVF